MQTTTLGKARLLKLMQALDRARRQLWSQRTTGQNTVGKNIGPEKKFIPLILCLRSGYIGGIVWPAIIGRLPCFVWVVEFHRLEEF